MMKSNVAGLLGPTALLLSGGGAFVRSARHPMAIARYPIDLNYRETVSWKDWHAAPKVEEAASWLTGMIKISPRSHQEAHGGVFDTKEFIFLFCHLLTKFFLNWSD